MAISSYGDITAAMLTGELYGGKPSKTVTKAFEEPMGAAVSVAQ